MTLIGCIIFAWLVLESFIRFGVINKIFGVEWSDGGFSKFKIIMFIATVLFQLVAVIMVLRLKKTTENKYLYRAMVAVESLTSLLKGILAIYLVRQAWKHSKD